MAESHRSLKERYPIVVSALEATYHFSRGQLLMNLILAVLAIPVSVYYGLIPWFQLVATLKVIAIVYLALLLATAVYNFVRVPLRLIQQQQTQIADLSSALNELQQRVAGADLPRALIAAPVQDGAPNLEFTNPVLVDRWFSLTDPGLTPDQPKDHIEKKVLRAQVMLARFYYKPERDVPPSIDVRAHLSVANSEGVPLKARYDAVWDTESESEYKEFETADTHGLVIGLIAKVPPPRLGVYEYVRKAGKFDPDLTYIPGQEFLLDLELIGKSKNTTVLNSKLRFRLRFEPNPSLELI